MPAPRGAPRHRTQQKKNTKNQNPKKLVRQPHIQLKRHQPSKKNKTSSHQDTINIINIKISQQQIQQTSRERASRIRPRVPQNQRNLVTEHIANHTTEHTSKHTT